MLTTKRHQKALPTQGSAAPVCRAGSLDNVLRITESRLERYTCPESTFNSTDPARPGPVQGVYNELASLMDVPGESGLKQGGSLSLYQTMIRLVWASKYMLH